MGKQIKQYLNQPKKAPKSLHYLSFRERRREWEERQIDLQQVVLNVNYYTGVNGV